MINRKINEAEDKKAIEKNQWKQRVDSQKRVNKNDKSPAIMTNHQSIT